ncbi:MAG: hypothetical protein H6708_26495 [Kofleriaceae bacterium]|nr:hypothetical protein [Kofleriaceae bacterium]
MLALMVAAGCGRQPSSGVAQGAGLDDAAPPVAPARDDGSPASRAGPWRPRTPPWPRPAGLARCVGRAFPSPAPTGFAHTSGAVAASLGDARHRAQDVIAAPGAAAAISGWFAYGALQKDLEGATVAVFVDDCAGWRALGEVTTDDDGGAVATLPTDLAIGSHEVRFVVRGDATTAVATAWILPAGTHLVVTDLDGTLTTGDGELLDQILDHDHVPAAYPGAAALTRALVRRGHVVVYLTGRPAALLPATRAWLADGGFAAGPVHAADALRDVVPTDGGVGAYKRAWLAGLQAAGYVLDAAYGNAATDIHAYAAVGIAPAATWIIGPHAGEGGTRAVDGTWQARADEVAAGPPVAQPF